MRHRIAILASAVAVLVGLAGLAIWLRNADTTSDPVGGYGMTIPGPETWHGVEWQQVALPAGDGLQWQSLSNAGRVGRGIVAWGEGMTDGSGGGVETTVGMLWTSDDGVAWAAQEMRFVDGAPFVPSSVAVGPLGLLALGWRSDGDGRSVLASSNDGGTWVEVTRPAPDGDIAALVAGRDAYWVLGTTANRTMVWRIGDDTGWIEVPLPDAEGPLSIMGMSDTPDGVVLTGYRSSGSDLDAVLWRWDEAAANWVSLGAGEPTFVGPNRSAAVGRVVPFAGGLFATGWAGAKPDCARFGRSLASVDDAERRLADVCPWMPDTAWAWTGGEHWQEVPAEALPGQALPGAAVEGASRLVAVEAGGAGLIALVHEGRPGDAATRAGLWTSPDGLAWARIGDGPGTQDAWFGQFVSLTGRFVALGGTEAGEMISWVGTPLR